MGNMSEDYSSLSDEQLKEKIAELEEKLKNRKSDEKTFYYRDIDEIEEELESRESAQ